MLEIKKLMQTNLALLSPNVLLFVRQKCLRSYLFEHVYASFKNTQYNQTSPNT